MRFGLLSLVLLTPAIPTAAAQQNCLEQFKFPPVGRWAEYQAIYNEEDPYTIRYAMIGTESRGGKKLQWVEMRITGSRQDQNMVYQMLVPGSLADMEQVQEIVFKPGDKPAMKMDGMMMQMIRKQLDNQSFFSEVCQGVTFVGEESVRVPAGSFKALHYRSAGHGTDSWVVPAIPFSLVKAAGKDFRVELATQGDGAKSSITEKPQEIGGMGGPSY
jgi:hypothetical protein